MCMEDPKKGIGRVIEASKVEGGARSSWHDELLIDSDFLIITSVGFLLSSFQGAFAVRSNVGFLQNH